MQELTVTPDIGQAPWGDLKDNSTPGILERVGLLRNGTSEGRASVAVVVRLEDGSTVIGETTYRLWRTAVGALAASPVATEETLD